MTNTRNLDRGTPAFMAPEITLPELVKLQENGSIEFLKKVDIWALGLVFYNLVNPTLSCPFKYDFIKNGVKVQDYGLFIRGMLRKRQLLTPVPRFSKHQVLENGTLYTVHFCDVHLSLHKIDLMYLRFLISSVAIMVT